MGRCNLCPNCVAVVQFKFANPGKRNLKKVKRFETAHSCTNPTSSSRKRRLNEADSLASVAVQGGQVRRDVPHEKQRPDLCNGNRTSNTKCTLKEDSVFDEQAFDDYCKLVRECTNLGKNSSNPDVRAEARSMIPKMRGLLKPTSKDEVDFAEATKDCSNIFMWWVDNQPAGNRAFIPDDTDREVCFSALKIYFCAAEEAKHIPIEYCQMFGGEGTDMYNEMLCLIGEREKKCLPFVNMCLRAWMNRLSDDVDLWSDLTVLDFEKWILEEMESPRPTDRVGKTSYELMMSIFGKDECNTQSSKHTSSQAAWWGKCILTKMLLYCTYMQLSLISMLPHFYLFLLRY